MESMYVESIDTNYINIATSNNMLTDDLIKAVLEIEQGYVGQWSRICELTYHTSPDVNQALQQYYKDFCDYTQFRHVLSAHIEANIGPQLQEKDVPYHIQFFKEELNKILYASENKLTPELRRDLDAMQRFLNEQFTNNPMKLMTILHRMLTREQEILNLTSKSTQVFSENKIKSEMPTILYDKIMEIENIVFGATSQISQVWDEYTKVCLEINAHQMDQAISPDPINEMNILLDRQNNLITRKATLVYDYHQNCLVGKLHEAINFLIDKIECWKACQARANNGIYEPACSLENLEDCCKKLAQSLWKCMEQIVKLHEIRLDQNGQSMSIVLGNLNQQYEAMEEKLISGANKAQCVDQVLDQIPACLKLCVLFQVVIVSANPISSKQSIMSPYCSLKAMVIELQPPQVLQKNKKFACKLRHLVADGLAIHQYPFEMSVNLIDEETAAQVMEQNSAPFRFSGHIQNNKVLSSFNDTSKQLVVRMSNLSLTKTDEDRGRNAVVANEKLCMFFSAPIQIKFPSMREAVVVVKTISLPIVIITHGKQESDAEGTIFWDNAFSEMRRKPFFITTAVPLFILLDRLDLIWKKRSKEEVMAKQRVNEEPKGLDEIARKFLTEKIFRHCDVNPFTTVNWNQFQKENVCQSLEKITFSFWKYFYNIMKLTCSEHMNEIWNAGHIYGFVGREESEKLLKKCATGTFLFRFSQSVLGAVSISCRTHGDRFGQVVVGHFKPDTIKTFRERMSLVDTVRKMKQLVYFYPNIPKQNVVGEAAQSGQVSWYVDKPVDM